MDDQKIKIFNAEKGDFEIVEKVTNSEAEWRKLLDDEEYHVAREKGTERAFTGKYWKTTGKKGIYKCVACGTDLFKSDAKFDSRTGWPSFWEPIAEENVSYEVDKSFFMKRTEILCKRCGSHLGHVFDDGPPPTGKRFCINSAALKFIEKK